MRILFVNRLPFIPQLIGGVETSTIELAAQLKKCGHSVAIVTTLATGDKTWLFNSAKRFLFSVPVAVDFIKGIAVYRGYDLTEGINYTIEHFQPEALIVSGGADGTLPVAEYCAKSGIETFHYFHDITSVRNLVEPPNLDGMSFFANSEFTAKHVKEILGKKAIVLRPLVDPDKYRTATTRKYVVMVNPRLKKGGDIALELAKQCPDIDFMFVPAWEHGDPFVDNLVEETSQLANVRWAGKNLTMPQIYPQTRLALVPSRWEETWGRIPTEAHVSGIPVLASTMAALPESVGSGGVCVDIDAPIDQWHSALRKFIDEPTYYKEMCDAAIAYSKRDEIQPQTIANTLVNSLRSSSKASPS